MGMCKDCSVREKAGLLGVNCAECKQPNKWLVAASCLFSGVLQTQILQFVHSFLSGGLGDASFPRAEATSLRG